MPVRIRLTMDGSTDSSAASSLLLVSVICIKNDSFSAKEIMGTTPFLHYICKVQLMQEKIDI